MDDVTNTVNIFSFDIQRKHHTKKSTHVTGTHHASATAAEVVLAASHRHAVDAAFANFSGNLGAG